LLPDDVVLSRRPGRDARLHGPTASVLSVTGPDATAPPMSARTPTHYSASAGRKVVSRGHRRGPCQPAVRSAASTVLRRSSASVVGPTPPSRGVIHEATSPTDSSTSASSLRPSQVMPPLITTA